MIVRLTEPQCPKCEQPRETLECVDCGAEPQRPGGPVVAWRHFQGGFGFWHVGGAGVTLPHFFEIGNLHQIKRAARQAGYTSLIAYNSTSHRRTTVRTIAL